MSVIKEMHVYYNNKIYKSQGGPSVTLTNPIYIQLEMEQEIIFKSNK